MPKPKTKSKCSPSIWKKFTLVEKMLWNDFYDTFLSPPELFHADWSGKKHAAQREVTAHNMACQAVWLLQTLPKSAFFGISKRSKA